MPLGHYGETTCEVGTHPLGDTPLGISDLAGNVAEWTSTKTKLPEGETAFIIMGGGYEFDPLGPLAVRVSDTEFHERGHYAPTLGFRCVR
jgi:formylglycine-generating enzyme required for sulfatase activity